MKIKSTVVIDKLEEKTVMFDTENNTFVELNDIGGAILDFMNDNGVCKEDSVLNFVKTEYDIKDNDAENDLTEFINGLLQEGFLEE